MPPERSTETLHSQILADIREKIVGGQWQPGHRLARETELAADYGVARMTMNKVLTQLAQEGYVVRRKRSGTFVARARAQSAVLEINNIAEEIAATGRGHGWTLLGREPRRINPEDLHLYRIRGRQIGEEVLFLQGLHLADDVPFCMETRIVNLDLVPKAGAADFETHVPGKWLLDTMPWTTARHEVRAVNAADHDASLLDLPAGAACLEILRETQMDGCWVTFARLLYPGEAHELVAEFEPRG